MRNDFCALILSHNRAGNVKTLDAFDYYGYSGDWYIVIDHPDDIEPYEDEYGEDRVIYFDKNDTQPELDRGDNFDRMDSILYARYYSFKIAKDLGYDYFIQLDDDYHWFGYRFDENFNYNTQKITNLDDTFSNAVDFLDKSEIDTLAFAQGGDYIGGENSKLAEQVQTMRKAMNSFICRTDRQFDFRGRINEDVNTYVRAQQLGKIFLTVNFITVNQGATQDNEGGLTEMYTDEGTYIKSFYTVLYSPSSVSLQKIRGRDYERIHHHINWRRSVPKILPESVKKKFS